MAKSPLLEALSTPLDDWWKRDLAPVEVAVLDSGIDATHKDLQGRVAASFAVEPGEGGPQLREIPLGTNNDVYGHGTAVGGIIARLAPNARLIDLRILGTDNGGSSECLVRGLKEAVQRKWPVLNLSLALKRQYADLVRPLCEVAWHQGQTIVSAMRNYPVSDYGLPAEFATSISVETDTFPDTHHIRFQPGEIIEFVALGDNVTVPAPGGGYTQREGTSMATPVISGLCAVLLGAFPGLLPFEVRTVLKHHAEIAKAAPAREVDSPAPA
jgi:subtilisin family serine protease